VSKTKPKQNRAMRKKLKGESEWVSKLSLPSVGTSQNPNQYSFQISQVLRQSLYLNPWPSLTFSFRSFGPLGAEPDATDRSMPVIGYRGWRVIRSNRDEHGRFAKDGPVALQSVNQTFGTWTAGGVTEAKCKAGSEPHLAPHYHCECGLYVLADLSTAPKWYAQQGIPPDVVIGAVVGWGNVIQHGTEGWRAQYAQPIAFLKTDVFNDQPLLEEVAQQYKLPILERKGLQLLASEYGESFKG
jgi:hypothetical protein